MSWKDRASPVTAEASSWKSRATPVGAPQEDGVGTKALKTAGGAALGVVEGLNPLSAPRGIETLVRAPFQGFKKANEDAILPAMRFEDVGRDIRTTGRLAGQAIQAPFRSDVDFPTIANFLQIQKEEQGKQDAVYNEPTVKAAKDVSELGTGLVSLAMGGKDAVKTLGKVGKAMPGAMKAIQKTANSFASDALKPLGKKGTQFLSSPQAQATGDQLLKDKIITNGASYKTMLKRVEKKLDEYGEKIGYFAKTADDAVARDSSLRGISNEELALDIQRKVIDPLLEGDGSTLPIAEKVTKWLQDQMKTTKGETEVSFQKMQEIKTNLTKFKKPFKASADDLTADAFESLWHVLNDKMEAGIGIAISKAAPDIQNDFKATKTAYRNLLPAEGFLTDTVGRMGKNRWVSLTDLISGSGLGVIGTILAGAPGAAVAIPAAVVGNQIVRKRGNQIAAGVLDSIANMGEGKLPSLNSLENIKYPGILNFVGKPSEEKRKGK